MRLTYSLFILTFLLPNLFTACDLDNQPLPVMGTIDRDFQFTNQDNLVVTQNTFRDKVYVADFFFTSCPTICPLMKSQMVRVYEAFRDEPDLLLLSHSIDPEHDTVAVLHNFAEGLEVDSSKWHFVTGDKGAIYAMAKHYMLGVKEEKQAPGGYIHSGSFCLVDKERRIRGYYNGTDSKEVDQLIADLRQLLDD